MDHQALAEGERLVGEWLWQAHGTRYDLPRKPYGAPSNSGSAHL